MPRFSNIHTRRACAIPLSPLIATELLPSLSPDKSMGAFCVGLSLEDDFPFFSQREGERDHGVLFCHKVHLCNSSPKNWKSNKGSGLGVVLKSSTDELLLTATGWMYHSMERKSRSFTVEPVFLWAWPVSSYSIIPTDTGDRRVEICLCFMV